MHSPESGGTGQESQGKPGSTITCLLVGLADVGRVWAVSSGELRDIVARYEQLVQRCIARHSGLLIRHGSDDNSEVALFSHAPDAVAASIDIQRSLQAEPYATLEIEVRIALHSADSDVRDGYDAVTFRYCQALRDAAHGRQVLMSSHTEALVRASLPAGVVARSLGRHRLADDIEPDEVFQLVHPELRAFFPPLRTPSTVPNNLPAELTRFIGRKREMQYVRELLLSQRTRLLTLTGPGGIGKTRLALELAREVVADFPDGVFVASLATIADPALVTGAICEAVRVREVKGQHLLETLQHALQDHRMLLVLDNFEHLVREAAQISKLLTACRSLKIIVTSRQTLRLHGEIVFSLGSLETGDSAALFVERACAVNPVFAVTAENSDAVDAICAHLDGLPIAIELAAASIKVLSPAALLSHLNAGRLDLLQGGAADRPPRQQALRATIDWSYDLLATSEQRLFRRLSVFGGGFTFRSATGVCANDPELRDNVLTGVVSLLEKSLLKTLSSGSQETRYGMFETLRRYGLERLTEAGELSLAHANLATWLCSFVLEAEAELTGPRQVMWMDQLEAEQDNIRIALQWCIDSGERELALRLGGAIWRFWSTRGYVLEGLRWLQRAIGDADAQPTDALGRALNGAANLARESGDYVVAETLQQKSLAVWRALGDPRGMAEALNNLGLIALHRGAHGDAERLCSEGLGILRQLSDDGGVAAALNNLGNIAREVGDLAHAAVLHSEAVSLRREVGDLRGTAMSLSNLANVVLAQCDYQRADSLLQESLHLRQALGDRSGAASALYSLGTVARARGEFEAARSFYERTLAVRRELGDKRRAASVLMSLGIVERDLGNRERAAALFQECLSLRREVGDQSGFQAALESLGALVGGDADPIARLYCDELLRHRRELDDRAGVAAALTKAAAVAHTQGDFLGARSYFEDSLALRREMGDRRGEANTLLRLGRLALWQDDHQRAVALLRLSVEMHREQDDRRGLAAALKVLGDANQAQGDTEEARNNYSASLTIFRELGDRRNTAECLAALMATQAHPGTGTEQLAHMLAIVEASLGPNHPETAAILMNLGTILRERGDLEHVVPYLQRAVRISEESTGAQHPATASAYYALGDALLAQGNVQSAGDYLQRALQVWQVRKDRAREIPTLLRLGRVEAARRDYELARTHLQRGLILAHELEAVASEVDLLTSLGRLESADGKPHQAASYFEQALHLGRPTLQATELAELLMQRGTAAREQGQMDQARGYWSESLTIYRALEDQRQRLVLSLLAELDSITPLAIVGERMGSYFESAAFRVQPTPDPTLFVCHPAVEPWLQHFRSAVPTRVVTDRQLDMDGVISSVELAQMLLGKRPDAIFVVYDQAPADSAWLQIAALRAEGIRVMPIERSVLRSAEFGSRSQLLDYLQYRYLGPRRDLFDRRLPISDQLNFFGRERIADNLIDRLRGGDSVALFGLRKMGKSSLLHYIGDRLDCPVSLVDLETGTDLVGIYNHILEDWARCARFNASGVTWTPPRVAVSPDPSATFTEAARHLLQFLESHGQTPQLALLVDEFELIAPTESRGFESFLAFARALRGLVQERLGQFGLMVAGVDTALVRTNRLGGQQNPFFNFFQEVYLPPLNVEDATQMIRNIGVQMGLEVDDAAARAAVRITGGHPYWARKLCSIAYHAMNSASRITLQDIDDGALHFVNDPGTNHLLDSRGLWGEVTDENMWSESQINANSTILCALAEADRRWREDLTQRVGNAYASDEALVELDRRSILGQSDRELYWIQLKLFQNWIRNNILRKPLVQA
jgi:predicted ATPase/TolA-binding protein